MPMFPVFIDINSKSCIVVGGGKVAARKIETLLKFGAEITVISPETSEEIKKLKHDNKVKVKNKKYSSDDLYNAYLVIAATDDHDVNEAVCTDAKNKGLLVNSVDAPEKCTFIFPSIITRDELVIGISTSGSFPALSKRVRQQIEDVIPDYYGDYIEILKGYRKCAGQEIKDKYQKNELMGRIVDEILQSDDKNDKGQLLQKIDKIYEEYSHEKRC